MSAILSPRASVQIRHTYDSRVRAAILDTIEHDLSTAENERITEWRWRRTVVPQYVILVPDPVDLPDSAFEDRDDDVPSPGPLAILYRRLDMREARRFEHLGRPEFYVIDIFSIVQLMQPLLPTDVAAAPRIPLNVYLDTSDEERVRAVVEGIEALAATEEFSVAPSSDPELRSWFRRFGLKLRSAATSEEVTRRLEKVERAIQIAAVDRPQSEVDVNQAEAVARLLAELESVDSALIQVGSMVLVKSTDCTGQIQVQARPLTVAELNYLEQHQELLRQPTQFLERLTGLSGPSPQPGHKDAVTEAANLNEADNAQDGQ